MGKRNKPWRDEHEQIHHERSANRVEHCVVKHEHTSEETHNHIEHVTYSPTTSAPHRAEPSIRCSLHHYNTPVSPYAHSPSG